MNIRRDQYTYIPNNNSAYKPSNILLMDPNRRKREEYSKQIMKKNNPRPKSLKFVRTGNPNQTFNTNSNQYNINYYPNSIEKHRGNNYLNYLNRTSKVFSNNYNENKNENYLMNHLYYDIVRDNKPDYPDYNDYLRKREKENNDNFSKRIIYGGRSTFINNDNEKRFNSKTDIFKKKNNLNTQNKDNLYGTQYQKKMNGNNNLMDNKTKFENLFFNNQNNNKDVKTVLLDNKKIINQLKEKEKDNYYQTNNIKNNNTNEDKKQNINNEYNSNINKLEKLYNNNIPNNDENKNNKKDDNAKNKNVNKEIEEISANDKDYLEVINTDTTTHHKANSYKSKSVNPFQNTSVTEAFHITNSIMGLNNLGATCYMNSALQNIIHCKKLIEKLIPMKNNTKSNQQITDSFLNLCYSLINTKNYNERNYTSTYHYSLNSFSPSNFKRVFCSKHSDYIMGQHDSIEFLRTLLDDISKEININQNITAYKELTTEEKSKEEQSREYHTFFIGRENSIIIDIFYIQIINIFTCKCGFESYSFQKFLDIPLLLPMRSRETDLISLIKVYLKEEILDWSSKCEKCKKVNLPHTKKIKFNMLNEVIIFSLQRFDPCYSMKSSIYVSFSEYINLKDFCDYDLYKDNTNYRLFGTINHIGNINYGHYYAYVRIGEIWYEFNDSIVRKINTMDYKSSSVCVLFYEKI